MLHQEAIAEPHAAVSACRVCKGVGLQGLAYRGAFTRRPLKVSVAMGSPVSVDGSSGVLAAKRDFFCL